MLGRFHSKRARREEPIFIFHRMLIYAKSAGEHGTILNYDDMQMGRLRPTHILRSIPQSTYYPIVDTANTKIREGIRNLGFADFWDYWFNTENITRLDPAFIASACYNFSIPDIFQRVREP
jgi:hypothetical protein